VALNKADALDEKEVAKKQKALEKAIGKKVFVISAIAKKGVFDCLLEVNKYITRDRKHKEDVVKEEVIVVDKPWSPV
jgi:GTPase involved in cell partitioning and DNA repair